MSDLRRWTPVAISILMLLSACESVPEVLAPPENDGVYGFANSCYAVATLLPGGETRWLASDGESFAFTAQSADAGTAFLMRPADLATYLFFDSDRGYLVAEEGALSRKTTLQSSVELIDETFRSPAEWHLEEAPDDPDRFLLKNYQTDGYLTTDGATASVEDAALVTFYPRTGCATFPELSLDAEGAVTHTTWPDGDVFGFVDTHTHMFTNLGFGGGGMFHGAPFHPLGVEHALADCTTYHGEDGRRDLIGYLFSGLDGLTADDLLSVVIAGMTPEPDHKTDGYPTFSDWPDAVHSATHQVQYYRWLERAYLGGLRLIVQHATTNSALCEFIAGIDAQKVRYSCNDMVAVDHEIAGAYALERYIDAQSGGPGKGWFRIVKSPAEAREVIESGHLAVILGIETSNLFDCFLTPREGFPTCDEAWVRSQLDHYYDMGVRAIFPVHKFDNQFSAGDGDRNVGQLGSLINSGQYSNFVTDCPEGPIVFDKGDVRFGGLNMPRDDYFAPPPLDMSGFADNPIAALSPLLDELKQPPLEGNYCQNAGLTPLGETLLEEMMHRGMIIEIDHMPRRSYVRAFELLTAADYPAVGSHGNNNDGLLYELGGVSKTSLGRCGDPSRPGAMADRLRERVALIKEHGGYPAEGFGFDLNGFAGGSGLRPRFGPDADCESPQSNPVTYPFDSFAGDVTFTHPQLGQRSVDFNTEGMIHVGLLPELIQDARQTGATDADLEPLFRSAEGYLRMWERAEQRAAALRRAAPDGESH
ncbi:MAG TPA: hypothetical protein VFG83_13805 [Kofleriaceae bacterium]|nr:hypothetical protein [Kofleriaceae bacterium]